MQPHPATTLPSPALGAPTNHDEDVPLNVRLDVDPASALRVVCAAQAGDVHHAALVDVHHAGCRADRGRLGLAGLVMWASVPSQAGWAPPVPSFPSRQLRPPSLTKISLLTQVISERLLQLSPLPPALMGTGSGNCLSSRRLRVHPSHPQEL